MVRSAQTSHSMRLMLTIYGHRSIGTYNWDPIVELEYPMAFQTALLKLLDSTSNIKPFRYVYLGGAFTEQNQDRALWFFAKGRHIRVSPCPVVTFSYLVN